MRIALLLALAFSASASASARAEDLKVGAASVDITPPVGTPMAGYYGERASRGVHDPLFAKALVLERDGKKAALVSLDLISTPMALVEEARREIEKSTGIRGADVMISATHAHTGPVLQARGAREDAFGGKNPLARAYGLELPGKIAESVRRAEGRLRPARVATGLGHESSIGFNRRFHMADGSVGWNPGKNNPAILKPAGPIDPDVAVVYFEALDKDKPALATYVNYAVHLDNVSGVMFSADLPATVAELLGRFKGPDMVTLYTAGCCGDINHIDVRWAEGQGGHANAARMGVILAAEVLRTWPKLRPAAAGPLVVRSEKVKLPPDRITPEEIAASRATITALEEKGKPPPFMELVRAFKVRDVEARRGEPIEVEVQVIALGGEIAWVSLPGEIFVELGLAIKQDSPFPQTIIAELANGVIGYIPSRRAYSQGNYEVVSARCAEGSGEILVDAAVRMLKQIHREVPKGPTR
jgi:neutral ceramidase